MATRENRFIYNINLKEENNTKNKKAKQARENSYLLGFNLLIFFEQSSQINLSL